jgi:thioredoxin-related protein
MREMKRFSKLLPFVLSAVFIASGITKLISVDFFEQFLYSFGVLKLGQAIVLTRLIIGFELSLGLLFLMRIYIKPLSYVTLALLVVFTGFIAVLELSKSGDDCYCFGTIVQLSNTVSIIKNIILAGMVILLLKFCDETPKKFARLMLIVSLVLGMGVAVGYNFPDNLFGAKGEITYCKPCFQKVVSANKLADKKVMICFFSTKCEYCQLSARKVTVIARKANATDKVLYVLWDNDHNAAKFFKETKTYPFHSIEMDIPHFMDLTGGIMPLIVLYDKGKIQNTYRYKDIDEDAILQFLKAKK